MRKVRAVGLLCVWLAACDSCDSCGLCDLLRDLLYFFEPCTTKSKSQKIRRNGSQQLERVQQVGKEVRLIRPIHLIQSNSSDPIQLIHLTRHVHSE